MTEKRRFLRFNTNVALEYLICDERKTEGISCVRDISREGVRFLTTRQMNRGTLLSLKLILPQDLQPVYLTGRVAWSAAAQNKPDSEYSIGVAFSKIDNFDRIRLLDYAYSEWLINSKAH